MKYSEKDMIKNLDNQDLIQAVWEKGLVVEGYNPDLYRKDAGGAWIARDAYADRNREFGWEIDHIFPKAKGGDNHFFNLRPMNWNNNVSKGDDYPKYTAAVTSKDNKNVVTNTPCEVNATIQQKISSEYGS